VTWQEGVAIAVVLFGLGAGAFLVAQRSSFWMEFGLRLGRELLPPVLKYLTRRMPPKEEAAWREAERRGQGDEWLKKRWCQVLTGERDGQILIGFPLSHRPKSPSTRRTA
jgi:hypothetical protein